MVHNDATASDGVTRHLQQCLGCVRPGQYLMHCLSSQRVRFENILFVTDASLEEYEFRAASCTWAMSFKNTPKVHESRLASACDRRFGEDTHPAHVFLKCEAFKVNATLSLISDLDAVVDNYEVLRKVIMEFLNVKHSNLV